MAAEWINLPGRVLGRGLRLVCLMNTCSYYNIGEWGLETRLFKSYICLSTVLGGASLEAWMLKG